MGNVVLFYELLDKLEEKLGGKKILRDCTGRMKWPSRGVYFFFEQGEARSRSGKGNRVSRVGTHGLKANSRATLWERLNAHRGATHGGNHRGSIFRLLIGKALANTSKLKIPSWGVECDRQKAAIRLKVNPEDIRSAENPLECHVSEYIQRMPFLWLPVHDAPGPDSHRGVIERGSIALLSNCLKPIDPSSDQWLGRQSGKEEVIHSGLWNIRHVDDTSFDDRFFDLFGHYLNMV